MFGFLGPEGRSSALRGASLEEAVLVCLALPSPQRLDEGARRDLVQGFGARRDDGLVEGRVRRGARDGRSERVDGEEARLADDLDRAAVGYEVGLGEELDDRLEVVPRPLAARRRLGRRGHQKVADRVVRAVVVVVLLQREGRRRPRSVLRRLRSRRAATANFSVDFFRLGAITTADDCRWTRRCQTVPRVAWSPSTCVCEVVKNAQQQQWSRAETMQIERRTGAGTTGIDDGTGCRAFVRSV